MSRGRVRNARGTGQQLREELVAAAARLVDEVGDASRVSLRAVAAAVGVAPTAVYLHFTDRDDLMVAVLEDRFAAFHAAIEAADDRALDRVRDRGDPLAALTRRGVAYVEFALAQPGAYRMMFSRVGISTQGEDLVTRVQSAGLPAYASLVAATARCIEAGRMRGPVEVMANVVWTVVHGYSDLAAVGMPMLQPPEELVGAFMAAVAVSDGRPVVPARPARAR